MKEPESDIHRFHAAGEAPFLKFPRGAAAAWKTSSEFVIEASGGLLRAPKSLFTLGRGSFRIRPSETCEVGVEFEEPTYFLSYRMLGEILQNRYVIELSLQPNWRENLWPHLFRFYMKAGQFPTYVRDFARLFRLILQNANIREIARTESLMPLQRRFREISLATVMRIGRNQTAAALARENAEKIIQKLVEADFFQDMRAEMEEFRSIKAHDGIVALAGRFSQDEIGIKTPFTLARPKRLAIYGKCIAEFMWEYGEFYDGGILCSSIELFPQAFLPLPDHMAIHAKKAQIPLDAGEKTAYGVTFPAPIICKGEDVTMHVSTGPEDEESLLRKAYSFFLRRGRKRDDNHMLSLKLSAREA